MSEPRIEVLPIEQGATTDPENINKHTARGGTLLSNSLQKRGAFRSIASAGKGVDVPVTYAGNYTLEKAVEAGFTEIVNVHVRGDQLVNVVRDDVAPGSAEAIALGLEDNESAAKSYNPDIDILAALAAGDSAVLSALRKEDKIFSGMLEGMGLKDETQDAEPQIDRAAELLEKWQVKTGDLWRIGDHRLLCGNSTKTDDFKKLFGDEFARLVWTDPPYGVSYGDKLEDANPMGYRVRVIENDDLPPDKLEAFLRSALKNAADFCIPGAAIYVASPAGTPLPALIASFAGSGFDYHWGLIWLKDQIVLSRADYHFKHENMLYGWKPGAAHYFTPDRTQASVFEYPRPKQSEEHPTMKPVELIQHMICNSSQPNDIVLDMFGGSGSTMLACENTKRQCRMLELEPKYSAVVLERMSTAFPGIEIERL
jgi:DNA modification methylase